MTVEGCRVRLSLALAWTAVALLDLAAWVHPTAVRIEVYDG